VYYSDRRCFCAASQHQPNVPRYQLSTFGRRAFPVAGPALWNSLPDHLRDPMLSSETSRKPLNRIICGFVKHTEHGRDAS